MRRDGAGDRAGQAARLALVALAYFGSAKLGLTLAFANSSVTAVWPPTGLALAAVLLWGRRMWPAVALGAFVTNLTTPVPALTAGGIAAGNTLEALVGAMLLSRVGFRRSLSRVRDVIALAVLAGGLSTMVSASIGVFSLWGGGALAGSDIPMAWRTWWLGDMGGDLLVAPALLVLASRPRLQARFAWVAEAAALAAGLVILSLLVLHDDRPFAYAVFPLIFWCALRFRQLGAVAAGLLVSAVAVWYTARGQGPFSGGSPDADLLRAQIFVGIATVTALVAAAAVVTAQAVAVGQQRYRYLVDRVPAVVYEAETGATGRWRFVSPQIEDLLGYTPQEWCDDPSLWRERLHPEDRDRILAKEQAQLPEADEYRLMHRDGSAVWVRDEATLERTPAGVPYWRGLLVDISDRKRAEDQLKHQAVHDPLTGLPNRTLFLDRLDHALARARRSGTRLAVLFCDLDDFKMVNDTLGHGVGDALLVALTPRLREAVRADDTVARFGGDEFVVICEDVAGEGNAIAIAERISESFGHPIPLDGREHFVTVSTGVVIVEGGAANAADVLRDADAAMYRAKEGGRGRYEVFSQDMRSRLVARLRAETELHRAVGRGELRLVYQPVVSLDSCEMVGAEALVRWQHPERQLLEPADFISYAEDSGAIAQVGRWVLEEACREWAGWRELCRDREPITVSVNLSSRQVTQPGLPDTVAEILRYTGADAAHLELEITERVLMAGAEAPRETLQELEGLGVRLVLDDFGTGYSSLSHLKRLPIQAVKIDRSFVDGLPHDPEDSAIVTAVLGMGRALGVTVIAEGVETEGQVAFLREHGCRFAQGYYFATPLAAEAITHMLRNPGMLAVGGGQGAAREASSERFPGCGGGSGGVAPRLPRTMS